MRVHRPVVMFLGQGEQVRGLGDVEGTLGRVSSDGRIDGGLEVREVDNEGCVLDVEDLAREQLEVVRFTARLGEGLHGDPIAADLLRGIRQGVEGGDDVDPAVCGSRGGRAAGQGERAHDQRREHASQHDNHSQLK